MIEINLIPLRKSINKAYLKVKPVREDFDKFKFELEKLLTLIDEREFEEHNKNLIRDFLLHTFYNDKYVNTKGRTDLAIHLDKSSKSLVGVIIEAKSPSNKADMITAGNLNCKAMHEVILYYLRERIENGNDEVKSVIITNAYEWFIFKADQFEKCFYKSILKDEYIKWRDDKKVSKLNDHFYNEIVKKFLRDFDFEIEAVSFDLQEFQKYLKKEDERKLIPLFKKFSPPELIKETFANDSNNLNKQFYSELLHIIGLEEYKEKSKKKIRRKEKNERDAGSLMENTIRMLKTKDVLKNFDDSSVYGENEEEQYYNIGLELSIIWIDRILFLKLLEAQLVNYHKRDKGYKFLNPDVIEQYDDLFELFHQVLAVKPEERSTDLIEKFKRIPYLNSSLFELSETEKKTINIAELKDRLTLPFYRSTVFDKGLQKGGELHALEYLLRFLDAYDFASEGGEEIIEERKTIINASVLGLIFEKINGYKEGSFYTPGFITMYMARETLRRAVLQKFNESRDKEYKDYEDLKKNIDTSSSGREEANKIINDLKICDPAVGSGHFLVSCLNEIIAIKADLRVLSYRNGRQLQNYILEIENDELVITNEESDELFDYHLNDNGKPIRALHDLQETLFHEKETIIENCLFGVDINPNSVNICRLRLWIELLKQAYYDRDTLELVTLPNIDINIKQGNSLISRFDIKQDMFIGYDKKVLDVYKLNVAVYKNEQDKSKRRELKDAIEKTKDRFRGIAVDPLYKEREQMEKLTEKLHKLNIDNPLFLHQDTEEKKAEIEKRRNNLAEKIDSLASEIQEKEVELNEIYLNAFEWRFEFPEVLDDTGNYVGFDVVIGNPPYGIKFSSSSKKYFTEKYIAADDIYTIFIESGISVIKERGLVTLIMPIFWLTGDKYLATRIFINEKTHLEIGINLPYDIFLDAYVDTGIYSFSKNLNLKTSYVYEFEPRQAITFSILNTINFLNLNKEDWSKEENLKIIFNPLSRILTSKLNKLETKVIDITDSTRGVLANAKDYADKKRNKTFEPIFTGKLDRYFIEENISKYIKYGENLKEKPASFDFFIGERLLIRRIISRQFRIMATFTEKRFVTKKDIYIFKVNNNKYSAKYLLAIFNSKLISYVKTRGSSSAKKDDFTQLTLNDIRQLGIPEPTEFQTRKISKLVDEIIYIKKQNRVASTLRLEKDIDEMVYQLYGLTEEEIRIVEGRTN
jgi:adenine-specific DNA-methyltransferase